MKQELVSDRVLTPFNPALPVTLAVDASPFSLGAVLFDIMPDGRERPIAYASNSLNATQQRYPQVDREDLAIIWGVKRFFKYICGRKFTLITDNEPLSRLLVSNLITCLHIEISCKKTVEFLGIV